MLKPVCVSFQLGLITPLIMHSLSRCLIAFVAPLVAQVVLTAPLLTADPAASSLESAAFTKWKEDQEKVRQDPSLVRLYLFDEGKGLVASNSAGDK